MPPSTGAGVREYCHNSYNRCFSKVEVHDFRIFSWLCVDRWIQLDVGIVSLGEILCFPCIPNTRLHNQKVLGVYRCEFKYHVGILSNRHMIRYVIYHMFVPAYSTSQILCFVLVCRIRVASLSNVDSIPFLNGFLIFLWEC